MNANDVKRFLDWWMGHAAFRAAFIENPSEAVASYGIEVEAEQVSALVDGRITDPRELPDGTHPAVVAYLARCFGGMKRCEDVRRHGATENPIYARWRSRQMARYAGQALVVDSERCAHLPYAIELSLGCSLRCEYCGFDAPPLSSVAAFAANEKLFREILDVLARFFGKGAESTFFYWATDPLDNPDYEAYLRAFHDRFGVMPGTTTAVWYRDLERTSALMELTRSHNDDVIWNRFSINTVKQLELCLRTWSAEELRDVVLALQCPGSLIAKSSSGRGRDVPGTVPMTQATVTGFLVNLPTRTVKLISPCIEPERWPLGYRVFAESGFDDASGLGRFLEDCQHRIMDLQIDDSFVPRLRDDFRIESGPDGGLTLTSQCRQFTLAAGLPARTASAMDGKRSTAEIARALFHPGDSIDARTLIHAWWKRGLIEDMDTTQGSAPRLARVSRLVRSSRREA